ncbi:MAG: hypothetical protein WCA06_11305 [Terrimicrobiaceae bacterium]
MGVDNGADARGHLEEVSMSGRVSDSTATRLALFQQMGRDIC